MSIGVWAAAGIVDTGPRFFSFLRLDRSDVPSVVCAVSTCAIEPHFKVSLFRVL